MRAPSAFLDSGVLAAKVETPNRGNCPYALFIGAGASVSSGVATAFGMEQQWREQLFRDATGTPKPRTPVEAKTSALELERWIEQDYPGWLAAHCEGGETPYQALFGHYFQHPKERQMHIERVIDGRKPTFGYLYLAGLIAEGRFNRVITTNFDDLLNDALTRFYDIRPIVCGFDSAVGSVRLASDRPKIIKLHGDFLYDNIKNVRHELKALDTNMEEKLYEMCKDSGLIVVGYSGEDESVMAPLRDMVRKPGHLNMGLHWCLFDPSGEGRPDVPPKVAQLVANHGDRVHLYAIGGFDQLMGELFERCNCALPDALVKPHTHSLPLQFAGWVRGNTTMVRTSVMRHHLAFIVQCAGKQADSAEVLVSQAEVEWELGAEARKSGDIEGTRRLFAGGLGHLAEFFGDRGPRADVDVSPALLAAALKRYAGLCIGLAKLEEQASAMRREHLDNSLVAVQEGITFVRDARGRGLSAPQRGTFHYLACCALGLLHQAEPLSRERQDDAHAHVANLRAIDLEGTHLRKLLHDEEDFRQLWSDLQGAGSSEGLRVVAGGSDVGVHQ